MPRARDIVDRSPLPVGLDVFYHHGGTVHSTSPLTVESMSQQWAYVVSIALPLTEMAVAPPILVSASVAVQDGLVGALVVANDWTEVLALTRLPAGIGRQRLEMVLRQGVSGHLVFRNCTPGERGCRFTVESVSVEEAPLYALAPASRLTEVLDGNPPRIHMSTLRAALLAARDVG